MADNLSALPSTFAWLAPFPDCNMEYSNPQYVIKKTLGVEVTPLDLHGNNGRIRLNIWDCGGDFKGLGEKYYIDAYGAIIFKKSTNNNHLSFEYGVPEAAKRIYITDFDMQNPEYTVEEYKTQLYNWILS